MEKARRRFFTEDYKRQTVELVRSSGRSIGSVAAEIGETRHRRCGARGREMNAPPPPKLPGGAGDRNRRDGAPRGATCRKRYVTTTKDAPLCAPSPRYFEGRGTGRRSTRGR